MHILIMPSWYPRDSEDIGGIFFREQAIGLVKAGHQVGLLAFIASPVGNLSSKFRFLFGVIEESNDYNLRTWRIFYPIMRGYSRWVLPTLAERYFKKYCSKYGKPQLIHVQSALPAGKWARLLRRKYLIPYCITEHSTAFPRNLLNSKALGQAESIFIDASLVMSVSSALASSVKKACSLNRTFEIVPNYLNHSFEYINITKKRPNTRFRFLNVALLKKHKGLHILIKAFAQQFRGKPVELFIGGDGEEFDNLRILINRLDIDNQVRLLGALSRDEVKYHMIQCDAFVLSSLFETFGVVVIEALACGKPVVSTKCGGPEEIVTDNFNGILVDRDSTDSLGAGMLQIYKNFSKYDPFSIQKDCLQRFSQKQVINRLEKLYKNAIEANVTSRK